MKQSRKLICITLMALLLLSSPFYTFATESENVLTVEATSAFDCEFTLIPSVAYIGRTMSAEVCFETETETEITQNFCAYFTVNGERSIDYTFPAFDITDGKTLTFYYEPEQALEGSTVVIGLCVEQYGQKIFSTEKSISVESAPIEAPQGFNCGFSYLPNKIAANTVLTAEAYYESPNQDFIGAAYFTVDGIRDTDYTFPGITFSKNKTKLTFYRDIPESYLGKSINIGLVIETQGKPVYKVEKTVSVISQDEALQINEVLAKVNPVNVEATVKYTTNSYSDVGLSRKIGTVAGGTKVTCISSKSGYSNQVRLPNGNVVWVSLSALNVSTKNYTNPVDLTKEEKEIYVNAKGYTSDTDYLIFINLERQMTNVFLENNGKWELIKAFPCATGTNANPTVTGIFKYYARQKSWDYNTYYVGPILIFNGNYALHSVLMRYNGTIYDGTVGRPASHGCVRLLPDDINWIANYAPIGTTVVIV